MSIQRLLREEIESEFKELSKITPGGDEYRVAVDGIMKLVDRAIELEKNEIDRQDRIDARDRENELKTKQMEDEKKDRFVKNLLTGVGTIGGLVVTIWGAKKAWKFEETGTVASPVGRSFINKLISFRK